MLDDMMYAMERISGSEYNVKAFADNFKDIKIVDKGIRTQKGVIGILDLNDLSDICKVNNLDINKIRFALYTVTITIIVFEELNALRITRRNREYRYRFTETANLTWVMLQNFFYMDNPSSTTNIKKRKTSEDGRFSIDVLMQMYMRSGMLPGRK